MASTHSATFNVDESPQGMMWRLRASTFNRARSVAGSTPTTAAAISRLSAASDTVIARSCRLTRCDSPVTTWLFVRM